MKKKEKVRYKLQTAFLILYFLEPVYFHCFKSKKKNKKTQILRLEFKSLKNLSKEFFFGITYSEKKLKQKKIFLIKNFFFCLNNFYSDLKQTKFYSIKHQHKKNKKSFSDESLKKEKENPIQILISLKDLLNV